jgi:hypothetical protein
MRSTYRLPFVLPSTPRLGSSYRKRESFVGSLVLLCGLTTALPAVAAGAPGRPIPQMGQSRPQQARGATGGVIDDLKHIVTIGSTVDPLNGDVNPYGLTIAPSTSGNITAGDLLVCNFNDSFNIQGLGTTIEVLHPKAGSKPQRLIADGRLTGCAALAVGPDSAPWVAAYDANLNPIVSTSGSFLTGIGQFPWTQPWGQAYSGTKGPRGQGAFYESNANDGSIVRINLASKGFTFDTIVTGFSVNHGIPGNILAPAGLTYDSVNDVLYIVDSNANRLVALKAPGKIPPGGVIVTGSKFGGSAGGSARVVFAGAPLAAPISSALLYNGDVVVGNTANNLLLEISPASNSIVGQKNLDSHAPGALFGIAATGTSAASTLIYFNDDNQNAVDVLMP